jgi:hypothetical protein
MGNRCFKSIHCGDIMKKVTRVKPLANFELELTFNTDEIGVFDVKPYLNRGIFTQLKDPVYFNQVRPFFDSITWPNGQDFDPDHLYLECKKIASHAAISGAIS